ncbi:hypothetical protein SDC9_154126 [bioreactor metagenome]|uniref:Uncharacterized protein n=1 Tax=bioreactor metagenome TaxID=1076179 RepID=A0A645F0A8_9ZZZZ
MQQPTQRREDQRRRDVKKEDDGDRLRNLLVVRADHRRGCGDGGAAADRRTNTD